MKLIVDVSDEMYELCKRGTTGTFLINSGMRSGKTFLMSLYKAIAYGTPLPKGHDRLVEMKAVIQALFNKQTMDDVPTIIEADKENQNDD